MRNYRFDISFTTGTLFQKPAFNVQACRPPDQVQARRVDPEQQTAAAAAAAVAVAAAAVVVAALHDHFFAAPVVIVRLRARPDGVEVAAVRGGARRRLHVRQLAPARGPELGV